MEEVFTSHPVLITIGMPVYNDKPFLGRALDSLLKQSYKNFELILSDDYSTDGSEEICIQYSQNDNRIRYIRQERNIGISRNMEFLLKEGKGEYFMWAGNDDLWDTNFISELLEGLTKNPTAIVSFCNVAEIDEGDHLINVRENASIDYSADTAEARLKKLIHTFYDGFGYGLFVRNKINDVRFPVWWWLNRHRAYNNIYPTLCFYLTKGGYVHCGGKPLWYNRFKKPSNTNHKNPFENSFVRGYFAFALWKFNLVVESVASIRRAGGAWVLALKIFFYIFWYWFLKPCFFELRNSLARLFKSRIDFW